MDEAYLSKQREILKMGAKLAPIVQLFGMLLDYNEKHEAVWTLPFNENLTNGLDVHGGAIATLIDNAGWFTLGQYYENWITTVEFSTRLLDTAEKEDLVATGHVVKLGKRISTARMEVVSKSDGRTIAIGSGTYSVTSVPLRAWMADPRST